MLGPAALPHPGAVGDVVGDPQRQPPPRACPPPVTGPVAQRRRQGRQRQASPGAPVDDRGEESGRPPGPHDGRRDGRPAAQVAGDGQAGQLAGGQGLRRGRRGDPPPKGGRRPSGDESRGPRVPGGDEAPRRRAPRRHVQRSHRAAVAAGQRGGRAAVGGALTQPEAQRGPPGVRHRRPGLVADTPSSLVQTPDQVHVFAGT